MTTDHAEQLARDHAHIRKTYDSHAAEWDDRHATDPSHAEIEGFLGRWDWNGTVLDLGCGNGRIGAMVHKHCPTAKLYGNDLSPQMAQRATQRGIYAAEVSVGSLTDELKASPPVEHVLFWGVFSHIDPEEFKTIMARAFSVAQKSVTLSLDDVPPNWAEITAGDDITMVWYNNIDVWRKLDIPTQWKMVASDRILAFTHPPSGIDIYNYAIRYEKS